MKIAAQLYSFRKEIEVDYENTFKKIKEMGFDYVQVDGTRGHTNEEIATSLKNNNLKVCSLHIKDSRFVDDIDGIIEECKLYDTKLVYCKYIDDDLQNEDGYRFTKNVLINATKILNENGITVGLHNPEYDFNNTIDGLKVMDYICDPVDGVSIVPEPDTYWLFEAKEDIYNYMRKYDKKYPILHLKDYSIEKLVPGSDEHFTEIGKGEINFIEVLKIAKASEVEYIAIEQDASAVGMFESFHQSLNKIKEYINEI